MEAGESTNRQSALLASRPDHFEARQLLPQQHTPHSQHPHTHPSHELPTRHFREPHNMATAALISPSTPYHGQASFPPSYAPHPSTGSSLAGLISPVEPRRASNESSEGSHRQSLPSLSEIMSGTKPSPYPPTAPTSAPSVSSSTFPSPFTNTPRTFSDPQHPSSQHEAHSSPQPLHPPPASFPPRPEVGSFAGSPRIPFNGRSGPHAPPLSSFTPPHPSPPAKHETEHKAPESQAPPRPSLNGMHPTHQPPPPSSQLPPYSHHLAPLPPGQMPLPNRYPVSPAYSGAQGPPPNYEGPPRGYPEEQEYHSRARYEHVTDRHLDAHGYQDALERMATCSRTIYNFAEAYSKVAQEQQTSHPILARLPNDREIADMINNVELIRKSLESTRELVQMTALSERAREVGNGKVKGMYDDDQDVAMYDAMKNTFSIPEVKKRRGRAAPPGRCHSCNRIDTPEWRRGPDGARTLCNACGLHYAKLERKRQMDARSMRQKPPAEEGS